MSGSTSATVFLPGCLQWTFPAARGLLFSVLILARESPSLSRFPEQQLLPLGLKCPGGLVGPHLLPSALLPARLLLRAPRCKAKAGACRTGVGFSHSAPVSKVLRGPCSTFLSSEAGVSLSFRRSHILFWIFFPLTNRGISAALFGNETGASWYVCPFPHCYDETLGQQLC